MIQHRVMKYHSLSAGEKIHLAMVKRGLFSMYLNSKPTEEQSRYARNLQEMGDVDLDSMVIRKK